MEGKMFLLIFPYFFLVHFEGLKGRGPLFLQKQSSENDTVIVLLFEA